MTEPGNVDGVVAARAIAGDREVLEDILAALQGPLYRYISTLLTHRETAEDIALQEVLFLGSARRLSGSGIPNFSVPGHFALPAGNVSGSCAEKNVAARKYWTWTLWKRAAARVTHRNGSPVSLIGWMSCRQPVAPSSCRTTWRR